MSAQAKPDLVWPAGYCLDPNGKMVAPEGKGEDFWFGYEIGYGEAFATLKRAALALPAETPCAAERGEDPRGCWSVRCQLGNRCKKCDENLAKSLRVIKELHAAGLPCHEQEQAPSETPVGHQIERDGKESGAVGGEPKGIGEASSDEMWATIERLGAADRFS